MSQRASERCDAVRGVFDSSSGAPRDPASRAVVPYERRSNQPFCGASRMIVPPVSMSQITTLHWPFERDVACFAAAGVGLRSGCPCGSSTRRGAAGGPAAPRRGTRRVVPDVVRLLPARRRGGHRNGARAHQCASCRRRRSWGRAASSCCRGTRPRFAGRSAQRVRGPLLGAAPADAERLGVRLGGRARQPAARRSRVPPLLRGRPRFRRRLRIALAGCRPRAEHGLERAGALRQHPAASRPDRRRPGERLRRRNHGCQRACRDGGW